MFMRIIYFIQHSETKEVYIGKTDNFKRRLDEHNKGEQTSTRRKKGEWVLVYAETYRNNSDADERESALKQHGSNKRWLLHRVRNSLLKN